MLAWAVLIGIGIWGMVRLTRTTHPRAESRLPVIQSPPPSETARQILDRRFANGELDIEEYAERRARIEQQPTR